MSHVVNNNNRGPDAPGIKYSEVRQQEEEEEEPALEEVEMMEVFHGKLSRMGRTYGVVWGRFF